MTDTIRVLRIIEYTGPRPAVEKQIALSLHGEREGYGGCKIRAATLGLFPEILNSAPKDADPS